ncbi:MAG: preprotein translocase subunit YajC [Gemmataceae bacterium]|nr:preprotein translocase subunit YajC [Gemmataceae bacterium]
MPILMMVVLGYFLLFRPMRQQEKQRQALVSQLKKNDEVLTSGGIYGIVVSVKEGSDEVALKIDENSPVRLRVTKGSIVRVIPRDKDKDSPKDKDEG